MAQLGNSGGRFDTIATPLAYLPVGYELAIAAFGAFAQKMSARAAGKLRNTAHTKNFRNSAVPNSRVLEASFSEPGCSDTGWRTIWWCGRI